jgi:hypothetical protein
LDGFLGQLLFQGMDLDQGFSGYWIKGLVFRLVVYWICYTKERRIWFSKNRTFCDCCVVAVLTGSENYYEQELFVTMGNECWHPVSEQ